MSDMTKAIAMKLEAANLGVIGQDIFYFHAPDGIPEALVVIDNLDGAGRDAYLPGWRKASFRVVVRALDYEQGLARAALVITALESHSSITNGLTFRRIFASQDPIPFPVPESDIIEVSCNFWTAYLT